MPDLTLPTILPRLGNLVEGWTGPYDYWVRSGPHSFGGHWGHSVAIDGRASDYGEIVEEPSRLACTRPEVQALLLSIHRREKQPLDSWFWQVPESERAALIRWSTLRLAAGIKACQGYRDGLAVLTEEGWVGAESDPQGDHDYGYWVPNYSEHQPDPMEVPDA